LGSGKMFGRLPSCSCCCSSFSSLSPPPPHMNTRERTVSLVWTQNNTHACQGGRGEIGGETKPKILPKTMGFNVGK
jgi:hypothetical protein